MSVTKEVVIWCDGCGAWERGSDIGAQAWRKKLKKYKQWSSKRGGGTTKDYCTECTKNRADA